MIIMTIYRYGLSSSVGLSPHMAVLVSLASGLMMLSVSLSALGGGSGGGQKKIKQALEVIRDLEAKLQLAIKVRNMKMIYLLLF